MKKAEIQAPGATVIEPVVIPVQPSEDLSELVGKRIGNYVIERHLGIGGMAVVFVARHPTLGREVAVKFLKPSLNNDPQMAERFLYEAKLTATLVHQNIVEILDFGEYERRPYYMMELLQGEDLGAKLRAGLRLNYRQAVQHLEQICDALEAAHKVGVVHRDLKPDNIFIVEQDPLKLKVMDFGVAKAAGDARVGQTLHGQVLGTPTHMAPEQALGQVDRISTLTDLYALGVIGYELLTGRLPFVADSAMMLISMHIRDPVPPIRGLAPNVPPRVAELVESCLAKDPSRRPRSARILAMQLLTACKVADRGTPAADAAAKVTPSSEVSVVDELALRLSRVEKPNLRDFDRFGIQLPNQIDVRVNPPSDDGVSTGPPAKPSRSDSDGRFESFFSSLPAPTQRGATQNLGAMRGSAAKEETNETRVPATPRAGTRAAGATLVSPDVEPSDVPPIASPDLHRGGDVITVQGQATGKRGTPIVEVAEPQVSDVSETMVYGGGVRQFQTGAALLREPEPPPPSSRGVMIPASSRNPRVEARLEARRAELQALAALQEGGSATALPPVLEPELAAVAPNSSVLEPVPASATVLLSEVTDDVATESLQMSVADGAILERLLRRMQRRGDFPSFLSHMAEIVSKANADGQFSAAQLAEALRKDFGLTAKLLKVVNNAFMSRFKGRVYSVHQSIVILGFDSVRSIASSVLVYKVPGAGDAQGKHKLVEGKYNTRLAESAINALVSGEIARLVAGSTKLRMDSEIAMMAAIFRNLGQHLVMQYLPEEFEKIEMLVERERLALPVASERVLGLPLRKLGCGVMSRWQLPQVLCDAVASQTRADQPLERETDRLGALARFATDLADLVSRSGHGSWGPSVQRLLERNRNLLAMDERQVGELMATITRSFEDRFSALIGPYATKSSFFANAQQLANSVGVEAPIEDDVASDVAPDEDLDVVAQKLEVALQKRQDPEKLAKRALQRVAEVLRVPRVLLFGTSADKRQLEMRAGVGSEVDDMRQLLKLPLGQTGNLFASAISTNKVVVVDDALSSKMTKRVPQPYYEVIGSPCFALLPCNAMGYPGALLLVDVNAAEHLPSEEAMGATKSLRQVLAQLAHRLNK